MTSDWRKVPVSEVASIYIGGTPSRSVPEYWGGDIKWASARDVANCTSRYISDTQETISIIGLKKSAAKILDKDTAVITARGTVGAVCMLAEAMAFNQTCYGLVAKQNTDPTYLYYALKASFREIDTISYGTVFNTITMRSFDVLKIPHPPFPEQQTIAHILGRLDDKVELNRQMSQMLDAMARALFKNWFVDFEPFREQGMQDSAMGEIPVGWQYVYLADLVTLDKGVSYKGEYLSVEGIPMINLGCFLGHGKFSSQNMKYYCGEYKSRHIVYPGDIVVANTDITQKREVLGSPAIVPLLKENRNYIFTHHVYALRFPEKMKHLKPFVYLALLQPNFRERAIGFATGTTVLALPRDAILGYQFAIPNDITIRSFNKQVEPLFTMLHANNEQSITLGNIRDALLPKLLSREIRVKNTADSNQRMKL